MMKQPSALAIAFLFALSACDSPSAPASPNPTGTWEFRLQAEPPYTFWRYDIKPDGTFERVGGALSSSREETLTEKANGTWKVDAIKLEQPSWWQKLWPWRSEPVLTSLNSITLSYWVPAKSDLSVGAKLMEKRNIGPALGGSQEWRIEETHTIRLRVGEAPGISTLTVGRQTFRKIK